MRSIARAPAWPLEPRSWPSRSVVMFAYVAERLAASSPFEIPSLTANIAAFAVVPPVPGSGSPTRGSRTASAGPSRFRASGRRLVRCVGGGVRPGLLAVRRCRGLHAAGRRGARDAAALRVRRVAAQVIVLLALAWLVWRPSLWLVGLIVLGTTVVILGGSRAALLRLGGRRAAHPRLDVPQRRHAVAPVIVASLVIVTLAVVTSPIGARAGSSYQELSLGSGTGGYRLALLEQTRPSWSVLGLGSSRATLEPGFTADLGVPNTFLALGFVGGALQFLVLGLALLRCSAIARVTAGVGIAGVMARRSSCLAARFPCLESGPSAVSIGVLVGAAAALMVPRPSCRCLNPSCWRRSSPSPTTPRRQMPAWIEAIEALGERARLELCVVDSGSDLAERRALRADVGGRVDQLIFSPNRGFGRSCNVGVAATSAPDPHLRQPRHPPAHPPERPVGTGPRGTPSAR